MNKWTNKWTKKEINEHDDLSFAVAILVERRSKLANCCSPFYQQLCKSIAKLEDIRWELQKKGEL